MSHVPEDPVDHSRTFLPHTGEAVKNTGGRPWLILIAVGVFAVFISLTSFGIDRTVLGIVFAVIAVVGIVVGLAGIAVQRKRVLRLEGRWQAEHPKKTDTPPADQ